MAGCAERNSSEELAFGEFVFCDYGQRVAVASVMGLWAALALTGNGLIILAVALSNRLRTRTNVFVVNLAVADLLTGLSLVGQVVALIGSGDWGAAWWLCSTISVVTTTAIGTSIHTLAAVALNRLILITYPLSVYRSAFTRRKMTVMVVITWVVPLLTATLPGLFGMVELGYDAKYKFCTFDDPLEIAVWYDFIIVSINYPVPLLLVTVSYVRIYRHVRRHSERRAQFINSAWKAAPVKRSRASQLQMDITKNTFYVVCAFVLCLTPYALCILVDVFSPAVPYTAIVLLLNSWINPIIYATKHPHFKAVLRSICLCRCSQIPEPTLDFLRTVDLRTRSSAERSHDGCEVIKASTSSV